MTKHMGIVWAMRLVGPRVVFLGLLFLALCQLADRSGWAVELQILGGNGGNGGAWKKVDRDGTGNPGVDGENGAIAGGLANTTQGGAGGSAGIAYDAYASGGPGSAGGTFQYISGGKVFRTFTGAAGGLGGAGYYSDTPTVYYAPGGGGGGGGVAAYLHNSTRVESTVTVKGGDGGNSGGILAYESAVNTGFNSYVSSGGGGGGGQAFIGPLPDSTTPLNILFTNGVNVTGGNGGTGAEGVSYQKNNAPTVSPAAFGGRGGDAGMEVNSLSYNGISGAGYITVTSGAKGGGGNAGGGGGAATLDVLDMMLVNSLSIKKQHGAVNVDIAGVDMRSLSTVVTVSGTPLGANDKVAIRNLYFGAGSGLTFTSPTAQRITLSGDIQVKGKTNQIDSRNSFFDSSVPYNAVGKNLYFQFNDNNMAPDDVMLNVRNQPIQVGAATNVVLGATSAMNLNNLAKFTPGQKVILIDKTSGAVTEKPWRLNVGSTDMVFNVLTENNALIAKLLSADAGKAMINNLSNMSRILIIQNKQNLIIDVAKLMEAIQDPNLTIFVNSTAATEEWHPQCTVQMDSVYTMVGIKQDRPTNWGSLRLGAFIDAGWGKYWSEENYDDFDLRGDGHARAFGGGVFGSILLPNGFGADASFRSGYVGSDLTTNSGGIGYDSSTWYVGGHLGLSWQFDLSPKSWLRPYGRVLWAHEGEDSTTTRAGEEVSFNAVDSARFQIGGRYNHRFSDSLSGYVDVNLEYEPNGRVGSYLNGIPIRGFRTHGYYGNLNFGASWRQCPETGKGWEVSADCGIALDFSNRRTVSGGVNVGYGF